MRKFAWRGAHVKPHRAAAVNQWFSEAYNVCVRHLDTITTPLGERHAVFSLHPEDVTKFELARNRMGTANLFMWWEDYIIREALSKKDLDRSTHD